jgi:hypothetical protein
MLPTNEGLDYSSVVKDRSEPMQETSLATDGATPASQPGGKGFFILVIVLDSMRRPKHSRNQAVCPASVQKWLNICVIPSDNL